MAQSIPSLVIKFLDNLNFPYEIINCKPEFADTQKLFLPVENLSYVSKYICKEK